MFRNSQILIEKNFLDDPSNELGVADDGFYPSGSPYRVQRHAANIRERKRMLRWV